METRTFDLFAADPADDLVPLEFRAAEGDKPATLTGYAAVFNTDANLGTFTERIKPGAFAKSLASGKDVRALVDHDASKILGRVSARTLRLGESERGLWVAIDLPDVSYARDLATLVKRGDIRGMSFGFLCPPGGDTFTRENGRSIRTLNEVDLWEVTATSVPAYADTTLSVRVDPGVVARAAAPAPCPDREIARLKLSLAFSS